MLVHRFPIEICIVDPSKAKPHVMTKDYSSFPRVERNASFGAPSKQINSDTDVVRFMRSIACQRIVGFVLLLNDAVKGKTCIDADIHLSSTILAIGRVLEELNRFIDDIRPSTGPRRFGNVAFRDWIRRLEEALLSIKPANRQRAPSLLREHLPEECHPALVEITPYFLGGFGSGQRLDYGTGHELSFAAFLCTLILLRILDPATDAEAAALVLFPR